MTAMGWQRSPFESKSNINLALPEANNAAPLSTKGPVMKKEIVIEVRQK